MHQGISVGLHAPSVTVQPNFGAPGSAAGVVCAWVWICWCYICFPLVLSFLLNHLDACFDSLPPSADCWIDVFQVLFTNDFVAKNRPSCRSGACGKLAVE